METKKIKTTTVMGDEEAIEINGMYVVSTKFDKKIRKELLSRPNHFDSIKVIPEGDVMFINDTITLIKPDGSATELIDFDHIRLGNKIKIVKIHKSRVLVPKDNSPLWRANG